MAIKHITVTNFKSFKELDIELGPLNVLIGPNSAGKSNFIQVFRFLRDIANDGLDNAISLQGGAEYFRNVYLNSSRDFSLKVAFDHNVGVEYRLGEQIIGFHVEEALYEFTIHFSEKDHSYQVIDDRVTFPCNFFEASEIEDFIGRDLGQGKITVSNIRGQFQYELDKPKDVPLREENISSRFTSRQRESSQQLLLEPATSPPAIYFWPVGGMFNSISTYDFSCNLPKSAFQSAGKRNLEEDGSNLVIVLKALLENKEERRQLLNLLKDTLSFIQELHVQEAADQSLLLMLGESYSRNLLLPAFLMSDGTMHLLALIVALYFEQKPLMIFEEPEKSVHPYLISKLLEMMKEASETKQIIITTHNPEVVKYSNLGDILLIARDKEGFSTVSRPSEKEGIREFLKNEIGIEELYVRNLLRA